MTKAMLIALGILAATASSALAEDVRVPFSCSTGTKCAGSFVPPNDYYYGIVGISCEWSKTNVNSIEVAVLTPPTTVLSKYFIPLSSDERTSRVATRELTNAKEYCFGVCWDPGQIIRITLTATTAGANSGTCYVSYQSTD